MSEGASDAVAMTHMGLNAIGRYNNQAGADIVAELLASNIDLWHGREIIIVGENDRKYNAGGKWPGRDGAIKFAQELAEWLGDNDIHADIRVTMIPAPYKDARHFYLEQSKTFIDLETGGVIHEKAGPDAGGKLHAALTDPAHQVQFRTKRQVEIAKFAGPYHYEPPAKPVKRRRRQTEITAEEMIAGAFGTMPPPPIGPPEPAVIAEIPINSTDSEATRFFGRCPDPVGLHLERLDYCERKDV